MPPKSPDLKSVATRETQHKKTEIARRAEQHETEQRDAEHTYGTMGGAERRATF